MSDDLAEEYSKNNRKKTIIGNDVWIGTGAFLKKGISVGDGAIIGAHSVVLNDVPDYAIVCGVPAKIKRFRFDNDMMCLLKESKWWEMEPNKVLAAKHYAHDVELFLSELDN
jgi:acetyltransferase-like isoleucine patch superfamily enzyme